MVKFIVFKHGQLARDFELQAATLIGPDEVPMRGQISFSGGLVTCEKPNEDAVALSLLWEVKNNGKFTLQTTRLADRESPYILNVELARCRLMRLLQKMEDWALFDHSQMDQIQRMIVRAKEFFVQSLQTLDQPARAADFADQSLELSMSAGDAMARFHAGKMLMPRLSAKGISRKAFCVRINPTMSAESIPADVLAALACVQIPINWAEIQPTKEKYSFAAVDRWFEFFLKRKISVKLSSVVRLNDATIPLWLKKGRNDFEPIRDAVFEYLSAVANRYGKFIRSWTVLSGVHCDNYFNFNFDQLLELTRLSCMRAKQLCNRASALVEILCPWGEYFARNPRTIHPFLYADLITQSGINFDGVVLNMPFGAPTEGKPTRDMFQLSRMIDRFAVLGKPMHIVTSVPSEPVIGDGEFGTQPGGYWSQPWTPTVQSQWAELFYQIAISKPQVESITWNSLVDETSLESVASSGLVDSDGVVKPAFGTMIELQRRLSAIKPNPSANGGSAATSEDED